MSRFVFIRPILISLLYALAGVSAAEAKARPQPRLPSIVFILTDDLDMQAFQEQGVIDSLLAKEGTVFLNHFVNMSVCCPSRVTTLRGQYAHNTKIYGNNLPLGGFDKVYARGMESATIATWLQAAGYRTALFGKYLNGYPAVGAPGYVPPGWSYWLSPNGGDPYQEYDYSLNENGKSRKYGNAPEDYLVDVLSEKVKAFIKDTVKYFPRQPFFIYLAPYIPHGPATPAVRYEESFPDARIPRTASFNEKDVSDKPDWVKRRPKLTAEQIADMDAVYRRRLQSMQAVEDMVKSLIDTLQAQGRLDNTYIFFTSDNGFHMGQHRLPMGKNTAFEEDIHVPLVVRGPGVPAGRTVKAMTGNVDFAPTFAAIAHLPAPPYVDGRSLMPFLNGTPPKRWRRGFLLQHKQENTVTAAARKVLEPPDPQEIHAQAASGEVAPNFEGLRTAEGLTYVEYETGERELYDLRTDPEQLTNVHAGADPALTTRLAAWLESLRKAKTKALRKAEAAPLQ
ncbi:sulfatase-like hydrolase/transferase [Methylococcus sp. Mc7]|uniref:sulfatase-like hydrolase/transferase n=1 Tax=Methylococcus sp. Mc7 TaxID=2860258 RepID=UPI001C52A1DA|nr:sulfatase-like hydrolase/transferase [Methylococcus sp. Mc7]QXP84379.1 sulfatase-like hydrolase/transferase [Methylococcus sp. Mc7]